MKKIIRVLAIITISLITILMVLNLVIDRKILTETEINAPTAVVWDLLMDHESYPEWNPFIKQIEGDTQVGSTISVTVQSPGNAPMDFTPEVLANNTGKEFRWVGKLGVRGIADGEHFFLLESVGPGKTKFVHGESFTGILSGLLFPMIGEDTEKGFLLMNTALKERAEAITSQPPPPANSHTHQSSPED